jgi:hypothetical protein
VPQNKGMKLTRPERIGASQLIPGVRRTYRGKTMVRRLVPEILLATTLACSTAPPRVQVELIDHPVTLSQTPRYFSARQPLRADNDVVGLCVYPDSGFRRSDRWTILTPDGGEARIAAHAELTSGRVVTLSLLSTTGQNLCVHPATSGPLEAGVQRVRVTTSEPVVVTRMVWQSTAP